MIPACSHFGISVIPFFPMAAGLLTGKYRRGSEPPAGSRYDVIPVFRQWLTDQNYSAIERFESYAHDRGHSIGELAIAWLLQKPIVCSVVTGATSINQIEDSVRAIEWELTAEEGLEVAEIEFSQLPDLRPPKVALSAVRQFARAAAPGG